MEIIGKPKAFVIMPFDPEFNSIYDKLIKLPLMEAGYDVQRADSLVDRKNILCDIIGGIANASLIIADITANNPNVLYELGLSHGLKIPTVLITQSIEEVPFDLRSYRIQVYSTHFTKSDDLKVFIKDLALKHIKKEIIFSSPITDFLHSKLSEIPGNNGRKVDERDKTGIGERDTLEEKGFLDFILTVESSGKNISDIMKILTDETQNISSKLGDHTLRIQMIKENPAAGVAEKVYKVVSATAKDINSYSDIIDKNLPMLETNINVMVDNFSEVVSIANLRTDEDLEEANVFRQKLSLLLQATTSSLQNIRSFRDAAFNLREMKISGEINRSCLRLIQSLDGVIGTFDKIEAICLKIIQIVEKRTSEYHQLKCGLIERRT